MNKDIIKKYLSEYEKLYPEQKMLNNYAALDVLSLGKKATAKPPAMNAAYMLDGHANNRNIYKDNFDYLLTEPEKDHINKDALDLIEHSLMIHHPENIINKADRESENQDSIRDSLLYLLERHGDKTDFREIEQEIYEPMMNSFKDKLKNKDSVIRQILVPTMVKRSPHHPEDYNTMFGAQFTLPIHKDYKEKSWKNHLSQIMQEIKEGSIYE